MASGLGRRAACAAAAGGASVLLARKHAPAEAEGWFGGGKPKPPGCLMAGTGEYVTGFVGGKGADSDKSTGVLGLVCLDLKSRGKIDRLGMVGVNGKKFPALRQ